MSTAPGSFVDFPDAAVIPSLIAQAIQQIFRFRPLSSVASRPLADPDAYELLRYFLASGSVVGHTFYGPMSFDSFGQNNGREPSTMQVTAPSNGSAGGVPLTIFPNERAAKSFRFPSPAADACPLTAYELSFGSACLLCAPGVCVLEGPNLTVIIAVSASAFVVLLFIAGWVKLVYLAKLKHYLQSREPLRLLEDGSFPRPLLPKGKTFHIFLSHCWFSGELSLSPPHSPTCSLPPSP